MSFIRDWTAKFIIFGLSIGGIFQLLVWKGQNVNQMIAEAFNLGFFNIFSEYYILFFLIGVTIVFLLYRGSWFSNWVLSKLKMK